MKFFKTWQQAFIWFIENYGNEFEDSYNLAVEFENVINKNKHGSYYVLEE